jgi:hypothetical protein
MSDFTFSSFFEGFQKHDEPAATEPAVAVVEPAAEPVATEPVATEPIQEQVVPSEPVRVDGFIDMLRQRNMLSDDDSFDPNDIYEKMIARATLGARAQQENEALKRELESLRSSAAPQSTFTQPPAQPPVQSVPEAPVKQRLFRELQKYDPTIVSYVEIDETGYAKPRAEYGQVGVDAARSINEYERATRQQAEMLINNPLAILKDNEDMLEELVERRAKAIVGEELRALREEQQKTVEQQQADAARQVAERLENNWHDENKAKIFRLTPSGDIATDVLSDSGEPAFTQMGKSFITKLNQLRAQLPMVDELTRKSMALEYAELKHPQQSAPVAQPAAPPVMTPAQQKRTLGGHVASIPNQNTPQASVHEAVAGRTSLRLADMVMANPANSERISLWR